MILLKSSSLNSLFIPIIAQMIHEGALQIAHNNMEQEVLANKIALFIIGRY
ncbi:hypothetical protein [Staphylococcus gallinarum]|uniref:hypothetical protein n=1 Tax=Staphylococcus gallinarum TaxID=1293 RepID=UPI003F54A614